MTDVSPADAPTTTADAECVACGSRERPQIHSVPETMFATGQTFEYAECPACGSLTLRALDLDLAALYPDEYYSFNLSVGQRAKDLVAVAADRWSVLRTLTPTRLRWNDRAWLSLAGCRSDDRIVDVGCGAGRLLRRLERSGWSNLAGLDPFIGSDLVLPGGTTVSKRSLDDTDSSFDLIMFHHSFEHMPDPLLVLRSAAARLTEGGAVLIRVPVVAAAWEMYGTHWIQIDAPRHLHLQTTRGFEQLASRAGLSVESVRFDSGAFQFWGSEQAMANIGLATEDSFAQQSRLSRRRFSRRELRAFERRAEQWNVEGRGDQAGYVLRRA